MPQIIRRRDRSRKINAQGLSLTVFEWTERTGLSKEVINYRLKRGWSHERAVGESATLGNNQHLRY